VPKVILLVTTSTGPTSSLQDAVLCSVILDKRGRGGRPRVIATAYTPFHSCAGFA
jgi:hypothetical protein